MDRRKDTAIEAVLGQPIETGPADIAFVFARAFELAMQIERERFLGAGHYERTPERRGYANGIETMIPRKDIDSVRTGQHATIRLTALNQRTTPALYGEVIYISADAIAETANGSLREVYIARVSLEPDQIARVPGFTPTPGMPAEIMIQTEERPFAQYLAKPIVDSMSRAFREQ